MYAGEIVDLAAQMETSYGLMIMTLKQIGKGYFFVCSFSTPLS